MNKFNLVFCLLSVPLLAQADQSPEEIEQWLEKMHKAAHMINYEGTFVYGQNEQLSSMRVFHAVDKQGEHERLISQDGSGREVIRSGNNVTCILPDTNSVIVEKSRPATQFPPKFPMKIDSLNQYYQFNMMGSGTVAGQNSMMISIKPRDEYRYGHKLWIDKKTGLLLKTHLVSNDGQQIEQFMFTSINYPIMIAKSLLEPDLSGTSYKWYRAEDKQDKKPAQKSYWKVTRLPPGFIQDMQRMHSMKDKRMPVEHMVFSDGLASVSVFIEKQEDSKEHLAGASRMGAVNAYGKVVNNHQVTVVGEVPHASVMMIGDSVAYQQDHD